jgi:hypothetical protein
MHAPYAVCVFVSLGSVEPSNGVNEAHERRSVTLSSEVTVGGCLPDPRVPPNSDNALKDPPLHCLS